MSFPLGPSAQLCQSTKNLSGREPSLVKPQLSTSSMLKKKVVSLEAESPQGAGKTVDMVWKLSGYGV